MAKLTAIICLGLLCVTSVCGMSIRGQGGKSHGGKSNGGGSQGGSSEEEVKPISKGEFQTKLGEFATVFEDASQGVGEIEAAVVKARSTQSAADWIAVFFKFSEVVNTDLAKLGPAVDHLGNLLERIAASPDEFTPIPYCDSSVKLASGKTQIPTASPTSFVDAIHLALTEDLGCFKDKLLKVITLDDDALKKEKYTEREIFDLTWDMISEFIQLCTSFGRFTEAQEQLLEQAENGGSSKQGEENANITELVRLLKQLDLGNRRK